MLCSIRLYFGITIFRYSAWSLSVLFIWLMHSVMGHSFWMLLISFACSLYCCISDSSDCYISFYKYVGITIVTETWLQHHCVEFDLPTCALCSTHFIVNLNPFSCYKFWWQIFVLSSKIVIFCFFILTVYL